MKKILLFLTVLFSFLSCAKNENSSSDSEYGAYLDTRLILKVQDKDGNNLLADTTIGYYDIDEIKTYIVENNKKVEYLGRDLNKRKKVDYYHYPNMLNINLYCPEYSSGVEKVIYYDTYIQFGSQSMDKITGYFTVALGYCQLDSARYNDTLIYKRCATSKEIVYPILQIEPNSN